MTAPLLLLLRRLPGADTPVPDGELLRRYAESRDEAAFAELVHRNGPLVLRACRNALRDPADADDAFQSAFILLARHAGRLVRDASVAGWLHTVAVRSARKIQRSAARRQKRESAGRACPAASASEEAVRAELRERIDAELARLPDVYRLPLLLCYVQGLSYADAARRLGCSAGALRGRLERGREVLRVRLGRWGLPAVLVAVGASAPVVGAGLRASTLSAVRAAGVGAARAAGGWAKWAAAVVLAAAVAGGLAAFRDPATPLEPPPAASRGVAPDAPDRPGKADAAGDPLPPGAVARMGSSRFHHGSTIQRLKVSPDGKWVVSEGARDCRIWDLATGREHVPDWPSDATRRSGWLGPDSFIQGGGMTPAGDRLVALFEVRVAKQTYLQLRDAITGEEVARVLEQPVAHGSEWRVVSADGKWVLRAYGSQDQRGPGKEIVELADLTAKAPKMMKVMELDAAICYVQISADGRVASFSFRDSCQVWDLRTQTLKLKVPAKRNAAQPDDESPVAKLSPDGKTLAVVHPDETFELWDTATRKQRPALAGALGKWMTIQCFSPDGKQLVGGCSHGSMLRVWDVTTGQKVRDYHEDRAWGAAFTPDGKRIAVGRDDHVNVLNAATGKPVHDFGGHDGTVWRVKFTPDGRLLTYGGTGLIEWDPRTGRKLSGREYKDISYLDTSRDGKRIVTTGTDQKIRLWSPSQLNELHVTNPHREPSFSVQLHPDGKEFIVGGDKPGIQVFDAGTGRLLRTVAVGETTYLTQFSPDGRRLVFHRAGDRTTLVVWDWAAGKPSFTLDFGEQNLCSQKAFSTDGRQMAVGNIEGHIRVFDLNTGKQVHEVNMKDCTDARADSSERVGGVSFSPDGRLLATGANDGMVRVWELATGGERFRLAGHRGDVWALAYSPDGALLVSGSSDRSVVTWEATGTGLPVDPKHQPKDVADAWARLADRDAAAGFAAVRYLSARPDEAVPLLAKGLRPVPAADPKAVAGLVEKLRSEDFVEREGAQKELAALGEGAADALRSALAKATDAESRLRLAKLLAPLEGVARSGDRLRAVRAVEVLERAGTGESRELLRGWSGGARGAELTEAARSALARLDARAAAPKAPRAAPDR